MEGRIDQEQLRPSLRARAALKGWQRRLRTVGFLQRDEMSEKVFLISLGVGMLAGLWLVRGALGSGPPAGEDVMGHLTRVQFGLDHVVREGRLDAWFPRFMTGHQLFLINGPGFTWVAGITQALTLGWLTVDTAMAVLAVGSFLLTVPAVAFLARSFGIGRTASALAGILAITVSSTRSLGLEGMFITGLIPQQVGAVLFCASLGSAVRLSKDPSVRWVIPTAIAGGMLLLTHLRSALAALIVFVLYSIANARTVLRGKSLVMLGISAMTVVGLTAFWMVPFVAHLDLRGTITAFGPSTFGQRIGEVWRGDHLLPALIARLAFGASLLAVAIFLTVRRSYMVLVWLPIALFSLGYGLQEAGLAELSVQIVDRAIGYVGILFLFPLAVLLGEAVCRRPTWQLPLVGIVALAAVYLVRPEAGYAAKFPQAIPEMARAASVLATSLDGTDRFVVQRDYPDEIARTGVIHPETWLARHSSRNTLNVFNPEATPSGAWAIADSFGNADLAESTSSLQGLGATHVVATSDPFVQQLRATADYREVWSDPPMAIFELERSRFISSVDGTSIEAELPAGEPDHFELVASIESPSRVYIPVSWSPKWSVGVDGQEVPVTREADNLVGFDLPGGTHRVSVAFGSDIWDAIGIALTALTLGWALAATASKRMKGLRR